jgi:hypothetical protein
MTVSISKTVYKVTNWTGFGSKPSWCNRTVVSEHLPTAVEESHQSLDNWCADRDWNKGSHSRHYYTIFPEDGGKRREILRLQFPVNRMNSPNFRVFRQHFEAEAAERKVGACVSAWNPWPKHYFYRSEAWVCIPRQSGLKIDFCYEWGALVWQTRDALIVPYLVQMRGMAGLGTGELKREIRAASPNKLLDKRFSHV